jgi:thiamine biosynthesis protein ThiS
MQLIINGEQRKIDGVASVAELIDKLMLDTRKIAIELNLEIVPRSCYAKTLLKNGDRLEVVEFIGGG